MGRCWDSRLLTVRLCLIQGGLWDLQLLCTFLIAQRSSELSWLTAPHLFEWLPARQPFSKQQISSEEDLKGVFQTSAILPLPSTFKETEVTFPLNTSGTAIFWGRGRSDAACALSILCVCPETSWQCDISQAANGLPCVWNLVISRQVLCDPSNEWWIRYLRYFLSATA